MAPHQTRGFAGCACASNAENVPPPHPPPPRLQRKPLGSDPDMNYGACVKHVPWCMSGSLTRADTKKTFPAFTVHLTRRPWWWYDIITHNIFCGWKVNVSHCLQRWSMSNLFVQITGLSYVILGIAICIGFLYVLLVIAIYMWHKPISSEHEMRHMSI